MKRCDLSGLDSQQTNAINEVRRLLDETSVTSPEDLAIVSGAGVSIEHPTHAPDGPALLSHALAVCFNEGTKTGLDDIYLELLSITNPSLAPSAIRSKLLPTRPRLETVLDVADRWGTPTQLGDILDNFRDLQPNRIHHLLALHLLAGGRQITANFDRLIETAQSLHGDSYNSPYHFHGQIYDDTPEMSSLPFGATLRRIENGFNSADKKRILETFSSLETKAIAWIGYSFSDHFDMNRALFEAIESGLLQEKSFIWFSYTDDDCLIHRISTESPPADLPEVLRAALDGGIRVYRVSGRSGDALYHMLRELGLPVQDIWQSPMTCDYREPKISPPLPALPKQLDENASKERTTLELVMTLGLIGRVSQEGEFLGLKLEDLPESYRVEYWWKQGKYERAREAAHSEIAADDPTALMSHLLIDARFDWIEGRLRKAGQNVVAAILLAERDPAIGFEAKGEALERFGRIAVHMKRMPDARVFILPRLLRALPDYELRVQAYLDEAAQRVRLGAPTALANTQHVEDALQHFQVEVRDVNLDNSLARPVPRSNRSKAIEIFSQSESLGNLVDYLRGEANDGNWQYAFDDYGNWQPSLSRLYRIVGNRGDRNRMILLTSYGPRSAPSVMDAFRAAFELEISIWQRARMLSSYTKHRFRG